MSISVPAAEAFLASGNVFAVEVNSSWLIRPGGVREGVAAALLFGSWIWIPKFPDGLQIALLTSRPGDASTDDHSLLAT